MHGGNGGVGMTQHSERIDKLVEALAKAQGLIENPSRDREVTVTMKSGGKYKFKYATLGGIIDTIRKPFTENGLWFSQHVSRVENTDVLTTRLLHSSGQWLASETIITTDEGGGNQQFGSALTYMRRYTLCALLGIVADEDDDGNAGDGHDAEVRPRQTQQRTTQRAATGTPDVRYSDAELPDAITAAENDLESNGVLTAEQIVKARMKYGNSAAPDKMTPIGQRSYLSKLQEQLKKVS